MEVPLNPLGRSEIHQLESILLFASLFRPEVVEMIKNPEERLTWVDSLAVAAGAIAREKAGMTVGEIAEELGRTEHTIRKHLKGETKAGQIVRETYELIKKGKLDELVRTIELIERGEFISKEEYERLKAENDKLRRKVDELEAYKIKFEELRQKIEKLKDEIERLLE